MTQERKHIYVYLALLLASVAFLIALCLFLADARKLHTEGTLRRPPKHVRQELTRPVVAPNAETTPYIPSGSGTTQ